MPVISTEPVKLPPLWQPVAWQVLSPGAPVLPVGGLLGLRLEDSTTKIVAGKSKKVVNFSFIQRVLKTGAMVGFVLIKMVASLKN